VPKRIALKLKGEKSANAPFTTEKFMPQMKLIVKSNKSTVDILDFAAGAGTASVITFHSIGQFPNRQDCKPLRIDCIKTFALAVYRLSKKQPVLRNKKRD
jgi:hypothetical protein